MIDDFENRVARAKGIIGPDRIENGSTPLAPSSPAAAHQTDATLRFDPAQANIADKKLREEEAAKRRNVQHIEMPDTTPGPDDVAILGNVRIERSKVSGWEKVMTRNPQDFYVYVEDVQVEPSAALGAIFDAVRKQGK